MNITIIPVVKGAQGITSKNLKIRLENSGI